MIKVMTFNDMKFIPLNEQVLALPDELAGFYVAKPNGYLLYDEKKALRVFVVANPQQGYFTVTARPEGSSIRYMYSTIKSDEVWLGMSGVGLMKEDDLIKNIKFTNETSQFA